MDVVTRESRLPPAPIVGAIVACRLDSARLPGKILIEVRGEPLLAYVVSRLSACPEFREAFAIATTERACDDPIAAYCRERHWNCYRGSCEDVAGRVLGCARRFGYDWFARVNGDSPFVDLDLLRAARVRALSGKLDFVTNLAPRSFPYGVSVEVVRTEAFAAAYARMNEAAHFEHVTQFLYEHLDEFRHVNLARESDMSPVRLTIDTEEDLRVFSRIVTSWPKSWQRMTYLDAVALL